MLTYLIKENWWIGLSKDKQGDFLIPYYVLGQDWQIVFADREFEGLLVIPFEKPYQENFEKWKLDVEKALFYGSVNLNQSESLFSYYEPIYRVIIQGNLQQIIDELTLLEQIVFREYAQEFRLLSSCLPNLLWMFSIFLNI